MAKAVIALEAFQARFGAIDDEIGRKMSLLLLEFLHEVKNGPR